MDIDEYLWRSRRTVRSLAIQVDTTDNSILKYKHKRGTPRLLMAMKIVKASEGQITLEELLTEEERKDLENFLPS